MCNGNEFPHVGSIKYSVSCIKLQMYYSIKLKSLPNDPCHDSIYNCSSPEHFQNTEINTEHIDN